MFEVDENDLPFVRTRHALLVLDLQNDFVSTGCLLPVENPPNFIDNTVNLASIFRVSGEIIWVRSLYQTSRMINTANGDSENVITNKELPPDRIVESLVENNRLRPSQRLLERHGKIAAPNGLESEDAAHRFSDPGGEPVTVTETFLTDDNGRRPDTLQAMSSGSNFCQAVIQSVDSQRDLIFQKTYYSAFKDGHLVQNLRGKFVTELYICGALTNISVFATAMDAARHGYAISIIEDCTGYISKARHDEALRQMTELTGCDVITSAELVQDLQAREAAKARKPTPRRNVRPRVSDLNSLLANLKLRDGTTASDSNVVSKQPLSSMVNAAAPETVGSSNDTLVTQESESLESIQLPTKPSEADGKKREKIKTKIKSRRRHSKSIPNEKGVVGRLSEGQPSTQKGHISPTSATLTAASKALEKVPGAVEIHVPVLSTASSEKSAALDHVEAEQSHSINHLAEKVHLDMQTTTVENDFAIEVDPDFANLSAAGDVGQEIHAPIEDVPSVLCEGDTTIINNILPNELSKDIFEKVRDEIRWQKMSHQGGDVPRLVAVQGEVAEDGSIPIYRHPADESPPLLPFSATVSVIKDEVEEKLGHPVNHVLIQFYRDGNDHISEHSDKTLDIIPNTFIANVSLGAQRTMVFRTKKPLKGTEGSRESGTPTPRQSCRASLPHNSMCKMGLATNMRWLHGIRQDKRLNQEKSEAELAFDSGRISLTFRQIGTFLDKDQQRIWGQGAVAKEKKDARTVINGETPESERMLWAFGKENHASDFDWYGSYGYGFDVLHISNSRKLFLSGDSVTDLRVKITLEEYGISWSAGNLSPSFYWKGGSSSKDAPSVPESLPVKFVDNDLSKSTVQGDVAILLYLDAMYGPKQNTASKPQVDIARQFTRLQQCETLLQKWRAVPFSVKPFRRELALWDILAAEAPFIAGSMLSLADYALWPVLFEIGKEWGDVTGLVNLEAYFLRLKGLETFQKASRDQDWNSRGRNDERLSALRGIWRTGVI